MDVVFRQKAGSAMFPRLWVISAHCVLIKSRLYGGGDKIEGRAALTARQRLDGFFFHTNPLGATAAELDDLKSAIILTTLGEQVDLLDQARDAGGGIKAEMLKLMNDPDRFDRFNDRDKAAIREIALGWSFFAKIRFKALHETIRRRGIPYMQPRTPAGPQPTTHQPQTTQNRARPS